jgi:hypothetical protein
MAETVKDVENEIVMRGIEAEKRIDWGETPFLELSDQERADIVLKAAIEGEFEPVADHMVDGDAASKIENMYGFSNDAARLAARKHPGSHTLYEDAFLERVTLVGIQAREAGDRVLVSLLRDIA